MGSVADNILLIMDSRQKKINELERQVEEYIHRYEILSKALNHFTSLELEHYTEMKAAFPDSDPKGHRDYHEKLIKAAKAQEEFWISLRKEMLKKGAWIGILAVIGMLFVGFEIKVKQWLGL